jgi:hypothetical protein
VVCIGASLMTHSFQIGSLQSVSPAPVDTVQGD